ncbi:MAG TPA: adenylosuccinate lyase [Planctomycetota bacterium]|nr:adenylosuccinate lyase [Planctomycetota bacterium]
MAGDTYESPLAGRYAGAAMKRLWSPLSAARTWRRLWLWLAEAERELGLDVTEAQLAAMRAHLDDVDLTDIRRREKETRHDVMAHLQGFGALCPEAKPILHWGATSAFVQDNGDLILMRESLGLVRRGLVNALHALARFARQWKDLPTLGYTHLQPAQPTTVGKRATLWAQDFLFDLVDVERVIETLPFRGVKGTTGTQASFLGLFKGDHEKVRKLDELVTRKAGFPRSVGVSGQTISRKQDARVAAALSGVAQSAAKFGNDLRLLQHMGEIEEPFEASQIGSSAMPYKRNPMRAERICGVARFAIAAAQNPAYTAATQWFERTLDDSSNRRLAVPELLLATDGILQLVVNVAGGLVVHPKVIERNLRRELPFLVTETVLMEAVRAGGDRQDLHEKIRVHARAAADRLKEGAPGNDLFERLGKDPAFAKVKELLRDDADPRRYVGRAPEQVEEFLRAEVDPVLEARADLLGGVGEVSV